MSVALWCYCYLSLLFLKVCTYDTFHLQFEHSDIIIRIDPAKMFSKIPIHAVKILIKYQNIYRVKTVKLWSIEMNPKVF